MFKAVDNLLDSLSERTLKKLYWGFWILGALVLLITFTGIVAFGIGLLISFIFCGVDLVFLNVLFNSKADRPIEWLYMISFAFLWGLTIYKPLIQFFQ